MNEQYLLEVNNLHFGIHTKHKNKSTIVEGISFAIEPGEIIGIVGESGSGKTLTALSIIGLLPKQVKVFGGSILFEGNNLLGLNEKQLRNQKGNNISMIFQEPMTSLNPLIKVGGQVDEMLFNHSSLNKEEIRKKTLSMFEEVGLHDVEDVYEKYPHQLSGGMRQRVMIAMAMICNPKLMIADEPTTALDVTVQAQILELIKRLNKEYGTSVILISHDLGVVQSICNRALVMHEGKIVEEGFVKDLFLHPKKEYTKDLLKAVPSILHRRPVENNNNILHEEEIKLDQENDIILKIDNLNVFYDEKQNKLFGKTIKKPVLHDISLEVHRGEIFGIVGESGSGKSTLAKVISGIHKDMKGNIILKGSKPQMVFQDSYGSLNPAKKVGWILEEPLKIKGGYSKKQRLEAVYEILEQVGLQKEHVHRYLNELSGGQRQRVNIANSLMLKSEFVILDEPVSALDVTVQAQILDLLIELRGKYNLTFLFISHDLNVIGQICDRVCVMHEGRIVESALVEELYRNPTNEYSKMLIKSIPTMESLIS